MSSDSSSFLLGVVSNCWTRQLSETGLEAQCRRAVQSGFRYVELRQRALGACEEAVETDDRPWPVADPLADLAGEFPQLGFNLAVEAPFMTRRIDPAEPYFSRLSEAALALAAGEVPTLRFVDVSAAPALLSDEEVRECAAGVRELVLFLGREGVEVALENSKQPVGTLQALIREASVNLPLGVAAPRLCWDAGNQLLQTFAAEDPVETARTVPVDGLFEFHFKQMRGGSPVDDVGDGDIAWAPIVGALRERGFRGPALFEIPPGVDIWDRLEGGRKYIQGLK